MAEVVLTQDAVGEIRRHAFGKELVLVQEQVLDALIEAVGLLRHTPTATQFMWSLDGVDPGGRVSTWRIRREMLLGQKGLPNG